MHLLFICSKNEWRSRTAETIFKKDNRFEVRSAGTARGARIRVNAGLLQWADIVFVMEDHHRKRLQETFPNIIAQKDVRVLYLPDEYPYMDPVLIEELQDVVESLFN